MAGRLTEMKRPRFTTQHMRRAVVKVHIARAAKSGAGAFKAHIKYLQRDGVDRERREGQLYDRTDVGLSDQDFIERTGDDRHQFRITVSPEDGAELSDLKSPIRDFMAGMEKELGRKFDWVAVDNRNTGQPHTHIVISGKDELGNDLVIDRDYLTKGLRSRLSEQLT